MKTLTQYLTEAMRGLSGDVYELKKDYVLYTTGDYDMFDEAGKSDVFDNLQKYLGKGDDIVIPKGSFIQLSDNDRYFRSFSLYTKKINVLGLMMNADQEDEILHIADESTVKDLENFQKKSNAYTI